MSRDPLGEVGGINLYGYVANNPIGAIDPTGLGPVPAPNHTKCTMAQWNSAVHNTLIGTAIAGTAIGGAVFGTGLLGSAAVDDFGGLAVKGIIQDGNILADAGIMGSSHATLAAQAGVLSVAADGTLSLTGGAEAFTAFGDGAVMGSTGFGTPQVSEAAQAAIRAYYGLPTP